MSTITAILLPDSQGFVHLPVPEEMRGNQVRVVASVETIVQTESLPPGRLAVGSFGRRVLVAPPGAPPMTSARIKAILNEEE